MPRPMPLAPPVMKATLPVRSCMSFSYFLPGTGRGTSRRLVEGAFRPAPRLWRAPSTAQCAVPLPILGRLSLIAELPEIGGLFLAVRRRREHRLGAGAHRVL